MKKVYILTFCIFLLSCTNKNSYYPKPRAYPRLDRAVSYNIVHDFKDFSFSYATDVRLVKKESDSPNAIWFNLEYPDFNAKLYCSYIKVDNNIGSIIEDNLRFIHLESKSQPYIKLYRETFPDLEGEAYGELYYFEGKPIAPFQFYLTDSTQYFLRGSLYYDVEVNADSIAPVSESLKEDIVNLIETFRNDTQK